MLEDKIKRAIIYSCIKQGWGEWYKIGLAIDWRINIARQLSKFNLPFDDYQAAIGSLTIQRQIEDELDKYQENLDTLSTQLQNGDIDQEEYTDKLELITAAIFFIAFLRGSESDNEAAQLLLEASISIVESLGEDLEGITTITDQDVINAAIPDENARNEIDSELAISATSAAALAATIAIGEMSEQALLNRIILWASTALGIYAVGQLFSKDDPNLTWNRNPLKDSCADCIGYDGKTKRASEWDKLGVRPQSPNLACKGFRCGCSFSRG
jgi:hypothetical protein